MTINQRKKGHDFERKVAKMLQEDLGLIKPIRRILNQYQEKNHPDLKLGRWNIECKAYKKGFEPASAWWEQVLGVTSDCLLYTSPSPRDPKTSRMPSSA